MDLETEKEEVNFINFRVFVYLLYCPVVDVIKLFWRKSRFSRFPPKKFYNIDYRKKKVLYRYTGLSVMVKKPIFANDKVSYFQT